MILRSKNIENRICVIDGYPGCGKTSWAIQEINKLSDNVQIMFITPYLEEVQRIIDSCPDKEFVQPDRLLGYGRKITHLLSLIQNGMNIVSTHALFTNINDELIEELKKKNYILFLDEVFSAVEKWHIDSDRTSETRDEITKKDIQTLIKRGLVEVNDDFSIKWSHDTDHLSKYERLRNLANRGLLYFVNNSMLLWSFPIDVFREEVFSEVYIMTHRFESQIQGYYYNYFNLEYGTYNLAFANNQYELKKGFPQEESWKRKTKEKIHIVENRKINRIGDVYYDIRNHPWDSALSSTWYDKHDEEIPTLKKNMNNFFQHMGKCGAEERMWTCFKKNTQALKGTYASDGKHVSLNARATNDYGHKTSLAYLINRFTDPFFESFFLQRGILISQEEYALSDMLQWIFRSSIRNNQEIRLYVPSYRMRTILQNYLNC